MSKKSELLKNTIILTIGKISTQFISFLLLPLYTSYLTTSEYGIVDLITTYMVLLVPIITFQLELSIFRYLIDSRKNEKMKEKVISNSYFIVGFICLIISLIFLVIEIVFKIKYGVYLILMLIATIGSNILLQTSRGLGDNTGYSISCIITGITNLVINLILLLIFNFGIYSILIATIFSNFIATIFLFFRNKVYKYISFKYLDKSFQKELLLYSLPLVPNGLGWWIINSSDRTIISVMLSVAENGIYSISNKFSYIISNFYNIFNMSWLESVSLYIDDKDDFLKNTFNEIFSLICSLCLCLINGMFIIFPILINAKFIAAYKYIPILILSSIFNMLSANLSAIYVAAKKTKKIAYTTIISVIINVIINFALIKYIGLYAAAISTLLAFGILFIVRYIDVQKYIDLRLNKKNCYFFIIMFTISFIVYEINNIILNIIVFLLSIIIFIILNFKSIKAIFIKLFYKE